MSVPAGLRPILFDPSRASRRRTEGDDLTKEFLAVTPLLKAERDRLAKLQGEIYAIRINRALVMQERASLRTPLDLPASARQLYEQRREGIRRHARRSAADAGKPHAQSAGIGLLAG